MEARRLSRRRRAGLWTPIAILLLYLAVTVGLFFIGPVDWSIPNPAKLTGFLIVNYGALGLGYWSGIRLTRYRLGRVGRAGGTATHLSRAIRIVLVASLAFNIVTSVTKVHAIRGLGTVVATIASPGAAYHESQQVVQLSRDRALAGHEIMRFSWLFRIDTVFGSLKEIYFPLGMIYWRRMGRALRGAFILSIFSTLLFTLGVGAQSGIGFLLFSYMPVALLKYYDSPVSAAATPAEARRLIVAARSTRWRLRVAAVVFLATLIVTVASFQIARADEGGQPPDVLRALVREFGEPAQGGVLTISGTQANYGLVMAALYASHGYAGLALSMELPFEWTYGFGWSKALAVIYHEYLGGPDLFQRTYLVRNEQRTGWPSLTWWSTIFPWVASDTTFFGTPFFTFLVGLAIARCWTTVLATRNPIGLAVLGQLFILVFMFPANNALAQTLGGLFTFLGLSVAYLVTWRYFWAERHRPVVLLGLRDGHGGGRGGHQ
jgi:hypothetical protein